METTHMTTVKPSRPTLLSPWFVVFRLQPHYAEDIGTNAYTQEWYVSQEEDERSWSENPKEARLFTSIHDASRVARGGGGYAVALVDAVDLAEYRDA
jgi:hypothetical protein